MRITPGPRDTRRISASPIASSGYQWWMVTQAIAASNERPSNGNPSACASIASATSAGRCARIVALGSTASTQLTLTAKSTYLGRTSRGGLKVGLDHDEMSLMGSRLLKLRRADICRCCSLALPAGSEAWWDSASKAVSCTLCMAESLEPATDGAQRAELDRGVPGASVEREYERRRHNREARTRRRHPWIGGLLLGLSGAPRHETAFRSGREGEHEVATSLERAAANGEAIVLHDRRMPSGYGNIDHLAVAPAGVFVIDAKNIKGKVRVASPLFGSTKLRIAGHDRSKLIYGLERQVAAVRDALRAHDYGDVPVQGVLCFTAKADLPLLGTPTMRGQLVLTRRGVVKRLKRAGRLDSDSIESLAHTLAIELPSA